MSFTELRNRLCQLSNASIMEQAERIDCNHILLNATVQKINCEEEDRLPDKYGNSSNTMLSLQPPKISRIVWMADSFVLVLTR